mgnify:CR=1 FL=1
MKKIVCVMLVVLMAVAVLPCGAQAEQGRGGFMGFIAGCCFGVRSAAAYNDGKEIHFREWCTLIPGFCIWNGIDGMNGVTTADYTARYGANYY